MPVMIVVSSHGVVGKLTVSFIAHIFGLHFYFFGIFKFSLILWSHLPIFLNLVLAFAIAVSWMCYI